MSTPDCLRGEEILEAVATSRWPQACEADLRHHAAHCGSCRELVTIATALADEHAVACSEARVPPSGAVWWRAQMRARRAAAQTAARPITVVQGVAFACAAGLMAGVVTLKLPAIRAWLAWLGTAVVSVRPGAIDLPGLQSLAPAWLLPLAAVWLLIAPIAIYFAVGEDK